MDGATPMVTLTFSQNKIKSDDLPLKKARKQGELPFPILSPIPFIKCTRQHYTFTKSPEAIAKHNHNKLSIFNQSDLSQIQSASGSDPEFFNIKIL